MKFYLTRTANVLFVFGFFFMAGCSTPSPTLDQAEETWREGDYKKTLSTLNSLLKEDPTNGKLLLMKAETFQALASREHYPQNRLPYYREMSDALNTLTKPEAEFTSKRDSLILSVWTTEQNLALKIQNEDSSDKGLQLAIDHFENARTINPDSISTYNLKAAAYYQKGDLHLAVEQLQKASSYFDSLPLKTEEKLAFLLLEEGQIQQSIDLYRSLLERHPENMELRHGLTNAYILGGHHTGAITQLQQLMDQEPENISYRQAAATELFFYIQNSLEELLMTDASSEEIVHRHQQLMEDLQSAEKHYHFITGNHPDPEEIMFITAAFYKNMANQLIKLAGSTQEELSESLHEQARALLARSIPVWESVAERNPENHEIWKSMYQVYSQLNMEEKAARARSNANL